jgi:hypothetical protein
MVLEGFEREKTRTVKKIARIGGKKSLILLYSSVTN